jgi:hypothetical protein
MWGEMMEPGQDLDRDHAVQHRDGGVGDRMAHVRVIGHEAQRMGKLNNPPEPQPPGLRPAPAMWCQTHQPGAHRWGQIGLSRWGQGGLSFPVGSPLRGFTDVTDAPRGAKSGSTPPSAASSRGWPLPLEMN